MAIAMVYPESEEKGGRGKQGVNRHLKLQFSKMHLSRARTVLRVLPLEAASVLKGAKTLTAACLIALVDHGSSMRPCSGGAPQERRHPQRSHTPRLGSSTRRLPLKPARSFVAKPLHAPCARARLSLPRFNSLTPP